jgi:hypothetical protein
MSDGSFWVRDMFQIEKPGVPAPGFSISINTSLE